jgi:hypothetical protein
MNNFSLPSSQVHLEKKLDSFYSEKPAANIQNKYTGLSHQNSSGNLRFKKDSVNVTLDGIQKLKTTLESKNGDL